jgi:transcriptional regulator with XRE-family HTH domain
MFSPAQLRRLRERRGWSRRELGLQVGRCFESIRGYEQGKIVPPPVTVGRLAAALGVEYEALVTEDEGRTASTGAPSSGERGTGGAA